MIIGFDTLGENPNSPTSAINYLSEFIDFFSEKDEHTILLFGSNKNKKYFKISQNIKFVNCHFSNENIIGRILAQQILIPFYLKIYGADILFSPLNSTSLLTRVPIFLKVNTLHHLHFDSNKNQSIKTKIVDILRKFYRHIFFDLSIRKASKVIANTNYTKNEIVNHYNIKSDKVHVIMEAYASDFGKYDKSFSKDYVKNNFGINYDYIIYPASFWDYKNHRGAIESFNILKKFDKSRIKLLLIGRDEENIKKEILEKSRMYDIEDSIKFFDFVQIEEIVHLMNASKVLFFPSKMETFGKPVVEAMISKTPIVGSNNSSIPELVSKDDYLCSPENYQCFAEKLHFLINHEDENYIENNFNKANDFSYKNSFENLNTQFNKILS